MRDDDQAEQKSNDARQRNPNPGRFLLHIERQDKPHDPRNNQREPEHERKHRRGKERILEGDKAGDDVENAKQKPEQKFAPGLDLEGIDNLCNACDQPS